MFQVQFFIYFCATKRKLLEYSPEKYNLKIHRFCCCVMCWQKNFHTTFNNDDDKNAVHKKASWSFYLNIFFSLKWAQWGATYAVEKELQHFTSILHIVKADFTRNLSKVFFKAHGRLDRFQLWLPSWRGAIWFLLQILFSFCVCNKKKKCVDNF